MGIRTGCVVGVHFLGYVEILRTCQSSDGDEWEFGSVRDTEGRLVRGWLGKVVFTAIHQQVMRREGGEGTY